MNNTGDRSEHAEAASQSGWFDGWRVVTGIASILSYAASMFMFAAVESARQDAEECEATGGWFCGDFVPVMLILMGVWALALGTCFGSATLSSDRGWRRGWTIAGIFLTAVPIVIGLAARSPLAFVAILCVIGLVVVWIRASNHRAGGMPGCEGRGDE